MKIPAELNGQKIIFEAKADEMLLNVLRREKCLSAKLGCGNGICGSCTILLNGAPVSSCKIPAGTIKDQKIQTLEYFTKTEIYTDIIKGFTKAGIKLCGFCNAGKIFTAMHIILSKTKPDRNIIEEEVKHLSLCCTDTNTLIDGIIYACDIHSKR